MANNVEQEYFPAREINAPRAQPFGTYDRECGPLSLSLRFIDLARHLAEKSNTSAMDLLVVDSHPIEQEGCRRLFLNDPSVTVRAARNIGEARALLSHVTADVMMIDVSLPDGSGLDFAGEISSRENPPKIVLFASTQSATLIGYALEKGVQAYVCKSSEPTAIRDAILAAAAGRIWLDDELMQAVAIARLTRTTADLLSLREIKVLRWAAKGLSLAEIAAALNISYKSATMDVAHLRAKLGAENLPELVRIAAEFRLI